MVVNFARRNRVSDVIMVNPLLSDRKTEGKVTPQWLWDACCSARGKPWHRGELRNRSEPDPTDFTPSDLRV